MDVLKQLVESLSMPNFTILTPEIIILLTAFILLVTELFTKNRVILIGITIAGLLASVVSAFFLLPVVGSMPQATFYNMIEVSYFSLVFKIFMIIGTIFVVLNMPAYYEAKKSHYGEYYYLVLFALLGLMIMISSGSLVSFYIGLELASITVYILAGMFRKDYLSKEGAFKYLIIGGAGTAIISYAIALIYGATGSFFFADIMKDTALRLESVGGLDIGVIGGLVLLIVGLALKASAVPFHQWTPDAYQGASTPMTTFMASVVKVAIYGVIAKVLVLAFIPAIDIWSLGWALLAAASMIVGNFVALRQENVKRMLAYSSIAHTGYITAAIASGTEYGVQALIFYSLVYLFMAIGSFIFLVAMEKSGNWTNHLDDFKGLARKNPIMALFMLIIMFSLLGIPPTVGFMGKLGVFLSLVGADMWWLAVVLIIMSVVSAGYYLRVVIYMYFYDPVNDHNPRLTPSEIFTVSFVSIIILILGIYPTIVMDISEFMSKSLLALTGKI